MGATLQQRAAALADQLLGATMEHPFGDAWDVWKVRGKIFMLHTDVTGEPIVILKAAPDDALALRQGHESITPGYHMNKRHWITVHPGGDVDGELLDDLVTESYLLVVEGLPQRGQPVDPSRWSLRG